MTSTPHATDAKTEPADNQHTTVRDHALAVLAGSDVDGGTVKTTVLREFHRQQTDISLEDILELNAAVAAPETGPLTERVETVLSKAVEEHNDWETTSLTDNPSESTSVPATETH